MSHGSKGFFLDRCPNNRMDMADGRPEASILGPSALANVADGPTASPRQFRTVNSALTNMVDGPRALISRNPHGFRRGTNWADGRTAASSQISFFSAVRTDLETLGLQLLKIVT